MSRKKNGTGVIPVPFERRFSAAEIGFLNFFALDQLFSGSASATMLCEVVNAVSALPMP